MPPLNTPTFVQFLANLTMAPGLFGEAAIDFPYWTLTYELVFYAYIGLALRFGMLPAIEWFGLLWVAIGYLFLATLDSQHHHRTAILLLAYYSNFFLIGMCLYRLYAGNGRPITFLALLVAIAATAYGGGEQSFWAPGYLYVSITAAFAALVWFATSPYGRWLIWRPLVFVGRISYPLYLVHCVLGFAIIRLGVEHGWTTLNGVIAASLASLLVATLVHYFVELPGERWSRSLLQRRQAVSSAIADAAE
jgi:peptidoglycan/LPS O-acetylase OafA/YrhL